MTPALTVPTYRDRFLAAMEGLLGKPVLWSMKGPDAFDCSGSVTWCLKSIGGPDLRAVDNAQHLHDETRILGAGPTDLPLPGDLVYYGHSASTIEHVAMYTKDGGIISADGATSRIDPRVLGFEKALGLALANTANRVRRHDRVKYRSDTPYVMVHRNVYVDTLDGISH